MSSVLVFGHKNPDNDSICSAVAYAHLKNVTDPENEYAPARLGAVPAETKWTFERFGVDLPEEITHVHTRVQDVMTPSPVTISPDEPMLTAGRLMLQSKVRALPVALETGQMVGLLSQRMLAERYLEETEIAGFSDMPVTLARLAQVLEGEILCSDPHDVVSGRVLIAAAEPETVVSRITPGDVVIVGDRLRTQPMAIEAGAACLIVTCTRPADEVVEVAHRQGAAVIYTEKHDTYSAARLVSLAHAVGDLMEVDVLTVGPDTLLSEAAEDLLTSVHRDAVVLDSDDHVYGMLTRTDIARGIKRRVVLVDHNERSQSAPGIEDAQVVEIVDHHRVGDIQTAGPILFLNLPVGSTATIVAQRYQMLGVEIPTAVAGILLSALLTDTVLLKSPTTTDLDREWADRLSGIVDVDCLAFGMDVFRSRSAGTTFSAETVVRTDVKEYRVGDVAAAIAQYEAVDLSQVMEHADDVLAAMERLRESRGYDLVLLMATDIVREGSEIFAVGKRRTVERALGISLAQGSAWMPGVLSRKKQIAARLVEASAS